MALSDPVNIDVHCIWQIFHPHGSFQITNTKTTITTEEGGGISTESSPEFSLACEPGSPRFITAMAFVQKYW